MEDNTPSTGADTGAGATSTAADTGADTGAGAGASTSTDTGGDAGAGAAAPDPNYPTPAEARERAEADLLGIPYVPRGTSTEDAGAATPDAAATAAAATAAAAAPTTTAAAPTLTLNTTPPAADTTATAPVFDWSKALGGKYKTEAEVTEVLTAAEAARTALADPNLQAMQALLQDPVKLAEFGRVQSVDYPALAKSDPKTVLMDEFRANNPQYSRESIAARFEKKYKEDYPYLDFNDPDDPQYQESVLLRDDDARLAAENRVAAQTKQRNDMLAAVPQPKAAEAAATAPAFTPEMEAAHAAAVEAIVAAMPAEYTVTVDGETVAVAGLNRDSVGLFTSDVLGYFEKTGAINAETGAIDYGKMRDFAVRAETFDVAVAAAMAKGIEKGKVLGAAAIINPGDGTQQRTAEPEAVVVGATSQQQQQTRQGYVQQQAAYANAMPDF